MLAGDTKVFKTIISPDDQHTLQDDLDYLTYWSSQLLLRFHPDKCKMMHLEKTVEQEYAYNLNVDNIAHELGKIEEEKTLGLLLIQG